ncbi:hypothetical protein Plhal304r1_c007g0028911 [Plasmopara halstedii]
MTLLTNNRSLRIKDITSAMTQMEHKRVALAVGLRLSSVQKLTIFMKHIDTRAFSVMEVVKRQVQQVLSRRSVCEKYLCLPVSASISLRPSVRSGPHRVTVSTPLFLKTN